ncbi:MAG: hypothetical protein VX278_23225, partial [Myxococcota bacterium]|nr:hypothetical protein [Myxococcota bacterium]
LGLFSAPAMAAEPTIVVGIATGLEKGQGKVLSESIAKTLEETYQINVTLLTQECELACQIRVAKEQNAEILVSTDVSNMTILYVVDILVYDLRKGSKEIASTDTEGESIQELEKKTASAILEVAKERFLAIQEREVTYRAPEAKFDGAITKRVARVKPEPPPFPFDIPTLHISGGGLVGKYSYEQISYLTGGPLYDSTIIFSDQMPGSTSASTVGVLLRARASLHRFVPILKQYLLLETRVRSSLYSVSLPELPNPINDWNTEASLVVIPRYYIEKDENSFHIGARIGVAYEDIMLFKQDIWEDEVELYYFSLPMNNPLIGIDFSALFASRLHIDANYEIGIANSIYKNQFSILLGYSIGPIFIEASYINSARNITVEGRTRTSGAVSDNSNMFMLGIGHRIQ